MDKNKLTSYILRGFQITFVVLSISLAFKIFSVSADEVNPLGAFFCFMVLAILTKVSAVLAENVENDMKKEIK